MRNIWVFFITLIITAGIVAGGGWWYMKDKGEKEKNNLQSQIDDLTNQINDLKGEESSSSASAPAGGSEESLIAAKAVVKNFLDAKKTRGLENAKPFMTSAFYNSTNQEEFAGTSSPSMGRYEITGAEYLPAADIYQVAARVYQNLSGEEVGYSDNSYQVVVENGDFLVNQIEEGQWTEI